MAVGDDVGDRVCRVVAGGLVNGEAFLQTVAHGIGNAADLQQVRHLVSPLAVESRDQQFRAPSRRPP